MSFHAISLDEKISLNFNGHVCSKTLPEFLTQLLNIPEFQFSCHDDTLKIVFSCAFFKLKFKMCARTETPDAVAQ